MKVLLPASVLLLTTVAVAAPQSDSGATPTAQQAGKAIYNSNCVGCHGLDVTGALAPNIRQYGTAPLGVLERAVLKGKAASGRSLNLTMPRYNNGFRPRLGGAPSSKELKDLQAFLKSVK